MPPESLAAVLQAVMTQLRERASGEDFSVKELDRLIVHLGPTVVHAMLPEAPQVSGSTGIGTTSEVPWIGIFPPGSAGSAQVGCYLVYLFANDGSEVYLYPRRPTQNFSSVIHSLSPAAVSDRCGILAHMFGQVIARFDESFERRHPSSTPESAALLDRICASWRAENRAVAAQLAAIGELFT